MKPFLRIVMAFSLLACNDATIEKDLNTGNTMETAKKKSIATKESDMNFGQAKMLIRRPVSEVFEAFINPEKTTKFWFTKSTGALEEGKSIEWIWEMYNLSVPVRVQKITENKYIQIAWGAGSNLSTVEWTFEAIDESKTYVTITNKGLQGEGDHLINAIRDSTAGFTMVLAGLKAYLEHGVVLNLIQDKVPVY